MCPEGAVWQFEISPSTQMSWYSRSTCWRMPVTRSRTVQMRRSVGAEGNVPTIASPFDELRARRSWGTPAAEAERRRGLVGVASAEDGVWVVLRLVRVVGRGGVSLESVGGAAKSRPIWGSPEGDSGERGSAESDSVGWVGRGCREGLD